MKNPSSDLCLSTCASPLFKPIILVDEHEIISDNLLWVLSRHPMDIWLSQDLKVFILFGTHGFLSIAKLIPFFAFSSGECGFSK